MSGEMMENERVKSGRMRDEMMRVKMKLHSHHHHKRPSHLELLRHNKAHQTSRGEAHRGDPERVGHSAQVERLRPLSSDLSYAFPADPSSDPRCSFSCQRVYSARDEVSAGRSERAAYGLMMRDAARLDSSAHQARATRDQ